MTDNQVPPAAAEANESYLARFEEVFRDPEMWESFDSNLRHLYEAGERKRMLEMIFWCFRWDRPVPEWARSAFVGSYQKVHTAEVGSLDEAFGRPYPVGAQLAATRANNQRSQIFARVEHLRETEGATVDEGLFERVGAEFGLGKTKCSRLYYEFRRIDDQLKPAGLGFREITKTPGNTT